MKIQVLAVFFLMASINAQGGSESHGGDVMLCQNKEPIVLDYFNATLPSLGGTGGSTREIEDITGMQVEQVVQMFSEKLKGTYLGDLFAQSRAMIGNSEDWILTKDLKDVNDEALGFKVPAGCVLVQAAVRNGSAVYLEDSVVRSMAPAQIGMLVVHEIFYQIAAAAGRPNSESTRQVIRCLFEKKLNLVALSNAAENMGANMFYSDEIVKRFSGYKSKLESQFWCISNLDAKNRYFFEFKYREGLNLEITIRSKSSDDYGFLRCAKNTSQCIFATNGRIEMESYSDGSKLFQIPNGSVGNFLSLNTIEVSIPGEGTVVCKNGLAN